MWDYIYSDELRHYGVKGMKWGVRRSKAQLARLTNRRKEDISDSEALDFKKEVKYAKRRGLTRDVTFYPDGRIISVGAARNSRNEAIGEEYADAIMKEATRQRAVRTFATAAVVAVGVSAVNSYLNRNDKAPIYVQSRW